MPSRLLGLILCELLTGQVPERLAVGHTVPRAQLAASGAPAGLVALLERALSVEPDARPADGAAFAMELPGPKSQESRS